MLKKMTLTFDLKKLLRLHRWTLAVVIFILIVWFTTPDTWSHKDTYFRAVTLRQLSIILVPIFIAFSLVDFFNKKPIIVDLNEQTLIQGEKVIDLSKADHITIVEKPVIKSIEIHFSKYGYSLVKIPGWFIEDVTQTSLNFYHYAKNTDKKFSISRKRTSPLKGTII
ncbi:hypothetical protein H5119_19145 [Pseudoalteromonas sp. SG45-5]|uniref:hypothetical protein n=1 Tax=unclassified Pseudoalteromonas TaxID=194690 RepID=UPI0015F8D3AE|nr:MULTISPECIES: hypothetical protein [unclassified Pseudoalteromonas]MBB1387613.1 hypothetical protein [Pseudoalteromonas sp. SG45-5]MBB1395837.1 hypothetical protein [Pseudoalteromonas sp. SG44-4]MBB1448702.1 hypothetical protein [Pseudoalteromonas sp. SG41-6]